MQHVLAPLPTFFPVASSCVARRSAAVVGARINGGIHPKGGIDPNGGIPNGGIDPNGGCSCCTKSAHRFLATFQGLRKLLSRNLFAHLVLAEMLLTLSSRAWESTHFVFDPNGGIAGLQTYFLYFFCWHCSENMLHSNCFGTPLFHLKTEKRYI